MILPLRQSHRRVFAVLGVVLPALFLWGLLARRTVPVAPAFQMDRIEQPSSASRQEPSP